MIDKKCVCGEIKKARDWKMTHENVLTLAALIYIQKHMDEHDRAHEYEHSALGETEESPCELTREQADHWIKSMENADGSTGGFFPMEETDEFKGQCRDIDFCVTMNMMKSDFGVVAKKFGVDMPAFYAEMAKAFLHDRDAAPGKLCRYHKYI